MTAQQTTVAAQSFAIAGTIGDDCPSYIRSYINEDTDDVPFGCAVILGTDPNTQILLPNDATIPFVGVSVHSHAYAKDVELSAVGMKTGNTVGVMRKGVIRVYSSEAIVVGTSAVRIRLDDNAGTDQLLGAGTFCKTLSVGHTTLVTAGMKWVKGCDAGGIAELEVNMTCFAHTADV